MGGDELPDVAGFDQRDVARHLQHAEAFGGELPRSRGDRAGMARRGRRRLPRARHSGRRWHRPMDRPSPPECRRARARPPVSPAHPRTWRGPIPAFARRTGRRRASAWRGRRPSSGSRAHSFGDGLHAVASSARDIGDARAPRAPAARRSSSVRMSVCAGAARMPRAAISAASADPGMIEYEAVEQIVVVPRHGDRTHRPPSSAMIFAVGPFTRAPPTMGDTATPARARRASARADCRHRQDRDRC